MTSLILLVVQCGDTKKTIQVKLVRFIIITVVIVALLRGALVTPYPTLPYPTPPPLFFPSQSTPLFKVFPAMQSNFKLSAEHWENRPIVAHGLDGIKIELNGSARTAPGWSSSWSLYEAGLRASLTVGVTAKNGISRGFEVVIGDPEEPLAEPVEAVKRAMTRFKIQRMLAGESRATVIKSRWNLETVKLSDIFATLFTPGDPCEALGLAGVARGKVRFEINGVVLKQDRTFASYIGDEILEDDIGEDEDNKPQWLVDCLGL